MLYTYRTPIRRTQLVSSVFSRLFILLLTSTTLHLAASCAPIYHSFFFLVCFLEFYTGLETLLGSAHLVSPNRKTISCSLCSKQTHSPSPSQSFNGERQGPQLMHPQA